MQLYDFLKFVITTPQGYFCLATKKEELWEEHWFNYPKDLENGTIISAVESYKNTCNMYFSAHLFSEPRSLKALVLPSKTIQADLDYAIPMEIPISPTLLVRTSEGRHQAYWILDISDPLYPEDIESIARKLAYAIPRCDRSGWTAGHKVRLPYTLNYKYTPPLPVELIDVTSIKDISDFDVFPDTISAIDALKFNEWLDEPHIDYHVGPQVLLSEYASKGLPQRIVLQYNLAVRDRSKSIWDLMCSLFRVGATKEEVYWLAYKSINNKFSNRDLRKDVLRAQEHATSKTASILDLIETIRRTSFDTVWARHEALAKIIISHMHQTGLFLHTRDNQGWYIPKETGKPISLSREGLALKAYLYIKYVLNYSDPSTKYIINALQATVEAQVASNDVNSLSIYDEISNRLLLHTGTRDVLVIDKTSISTITNGEAATVFGWAPRAEGFTLSSLPLSKRWYEIMFRETAIGSDTYTPNETVHMLRIWFLFLLFKNNVFSRPILGIFGPPGSGKSTLCKIIYRVLYGRYKELGSISDQKNFDISMANNPFFVLDNVDSAVPWFTDRLALSVSVTESEQRRLYTDGDVFTLRRHAMIGVTAHTPKFIREDIADRMLIISLRRRENFDSETELLTHLTRMRGQLWNDIISDIQLILNTPKPPNTTNFPQFRIADFASWGTWFARALGEEQLFYTTLEKFKTQQRSIALDEESLVVTLIKRLVALENNPSTFVSTTALWTALISVAGNDAFTFQKTYKNVIVFSKKLFTLQDALKSIVNIESKLDVQTGTRLWKVQPLGTNSTV